MKEELDNIANVATQVALTIRQHQPIVMPSKHYQKCRDFTFGIDQTIVKQLFSDWLTQYLREFVQPRLLETEEFIETFIEEFQIFKSLCYWQSNLFYYYESTLGTSQIFLIELALILFQDTIMNNPNIKEKWISNYIQMLNQIRNKQGEKMKLKEYQEILELFALAQQKRIIIEFNKEIHLPQINIRERTTRRQIQLSATINYQNYLLQRLIDATSQFYAQKSQKWLELGTTTEYVNLAQQQFQLETNLQETLYLKFYPQIKNIIRKELITFSMNKLLINPNDGLQALIENSQISKNQSHITNLYKLLEIDSDNFELMYRELQKYCKGQVAIIFTEQQGLNPLQQQQAVFQSFEKAYSFYSFCIQIIEQSFNNNFQFKNSLQLGFKESLNKIDKYFRQLAQFININLRDKFKETASDQGTQKFREFLIISEAFIEFGLEKASFFLNYSEMLKDRIFKGEIKNPGFEEDFLKELKKNHPEHLPPFIWKIWQEYKQDREQDQYIQQQLQEQNLINNTTVQFTVFTRLNQLSEFYQIQPINIPPQITPIIKYFENYYQQKYQTQKMLQWNFKIGHGLMTYRFDQSVKSIYRLNLTTLQILLLNFIVQNGNSIQIDLLREKSNLKESDCQSQLQPLLDRKFLIFENNTLRLQDKQTDLHPQVKQTQIVNLIPRKSQEQIKQLEQDRQMQQQINKDRDCAIQTRIVKLMKSRKQMLINELIVGVEQALTGYYNFFPKDIQRQIDQLINDAYMKRDDKITNKFHYTPAE